MDSVLRTGLRIANYFAQSREPFATAIQRRALPVKPEMLKLKDSNPLTSCFESQHGAPTTVQHLSSRKPQPGQRCLCLSASTAREFENGAPELKESVRAPSGLPQFKRMGGGADQITAGGTCRHFPDKRASLRPLVGPRARKASSFSNRSL